MKIEKEKNETNKKNKKYFEKENNKTNKKKTMNNKKM